MKAWNVILSKELKIMEFYYEQSKIIPLELHSPIMRIYNDPKQNTNNTRKIMPWLKSLHHNSLSTFDLWAFHCLNKFFV